MNESEFPNIKDYNLISKDMADLMVKQSEQRLKGTISSLESITSRADRLLSIYIPLVTALSVYIGSNISNIFSSYIVSVALIVLLISISGVFFCWKNAGEYIIEDLGDNPDKIATTEYVDNALNEKLKYVSMCIAICKNAHHRIAFNQITISQRAENNQRALKLFFLIGLSPFFPLGIQCLIWLAHCF